MEILQCDHCERYSDSLCIGWITVMKAGDDEVLGDPLIQDRHFCTYTCAARWLNAHAQEI